MCVSVLVSDTLGMERHTLNRSETQTCFREYSINIHVTPPAESLD